MSENKKEMTLDEAFLELDFSRYQQGMELVKKCSEKIDTVEKKVLVLNEDGETYEF